MVIELLKLLRFFVISTIAGAFLAIVVGWLLFKVVSKIRRKSYKEYMNGKRTGRFN